MWLTAAQQQTTYFLDFGATPTLEALYYSPAILNSKQSYVHNFLPIYESSILRPVSPYYVKISETLAPTVNNYLAGNISLSNALDKMQSNVNNIINNNQPNLQTTTTSTSSTPGWELFSLLSIVVLALEVVIKKRKIIQ